MKKTITILTSAILAATCMTSCNNKKEYLQSDPDVLTSRQIEILKENCLPTEMDKLTSEQQADIKDLESAFIHLDRTYPGVKFDYLNLKTYRSTGIVLNRSSDTTSFVPVGFDKHDDRNIVYVRYGFKGKKYSDNYMLVLVREPTENVIKEYLESYFGKDNFKVYVYPYQTDLKFGDDINEKSIVGNVKSSATLFLPSDSCTKENLDKFAEEYKKVYDTYNCHFRATIVSREDFNNLTYNNSTDLYTIEHMIYDRDIEKDQLG